MDKVLLKQKHAKMTNVYASVYWTQERLMRQDKGKTFCSSCSVKGNNEN